MIRVRYVRGDSSPIVVCDASEQEITDHARAMAIWPMTTDGQVDAHHVHQGRCDDAMQQRIGPHTPTASQSLADHLRELAKSVGVLRG